MLIVWIINLYRFINLVTKRQRSLQKEHEQVEAALKTIENGVFLAEELKKQLEHEIMVLEQKKKVLTTL